ncbi:winged helix-turn-helix domain-containing protein [Halococcus thailandensis]|uniref:winged helix-turn-helix domain-containing protein n=1 Tax=Halococcus thailandensis TaxID=335952 RepID=UPI001269719A|nr:MarR family winged helix-turn-helix transcriptional regulator [Halococcus thailandensis]
MLQLSERESQLPHLVTAGEMMQKLTPIRLATLSYLSGNDIDTQNEIADALGVSPTTITTHLQLLSDFPRPLTVRKRRYEITSDGDAVIELYNSMLQRFGEGLDIDDLSDADKREKIGEHLSPIHETRSIAPFLVLYSLGQYSADNEVSGNSTSDTAIQLKRILDDVKRWEEERGKTASRKQVRRILQRFEEFDVVNLAGDRITLLEKGKEHIRLLESVLELLERGDVNEAETLSTASQQTTGEQLTRSDTGGVEESPMPSQREQRNETQGVRRNESQKELQKEGVSDSALPAIVPAYRVVADDSQSSTPILPLTSTTRVEDIADEIERIGQEYGNARLELVWTNLRSEVSGDESASDSRLKSR